MTESNLMRFCRFCSIAILGVTVLSLVLAAVPFFLNGLHLKTYQDIYFGYYDPKGYFASELHVVALVSVMAAPVWSVIFSASLGVNLVRH